MPTVTAVHQPQLQVFTCPQLQQVAGDMNINPTWQLRREDVLHTLFTGLLKGIPSFSMFVTTTRMDDARFP